MPLSGRALTLISIPEPHGSMSQYARELTRKIRPLGEAICSCALSVGVEFFPPEPCDLIRLVVGEALTLGSHGRHFGRSGRKPLGWASVPE